MAPTKRGRSGSRVTRNCCARRARERAGSCRASQGRAAGPRQRGRSVSRAPARAKRARSAAPPTGPPAPPPVAPGAVRARHRIQLLEVCCGPRSRLAGEWARRGRTAVRVTLRPRGVPMEPAPRFGGGRRAAARPRAGRVITWRLNLKCRRDKRALRAFVREARPKDLWTSPPCTTSCPLQRLALARRRGGRRPCGEAAQRRLLGYCRGLHRLQRSLGGRSHHEQSAVSRAPFDSRRRPWAVLPGTAAATIAGCAVGLRERGGRRRLLAKAWWVESSYLALVTRLAQLRCSGTHRHGVCMGRQQTAASANYTPKLVCCIADAIVKRRAR